MALINTEDLTQFGNEYKEKLNLENYNIVRTICEGVTIGSGAIYHQFSESINLVEGNFYLLKYNLSGASEYPSSINDWLYDGNYVLVSKAVTTESYKDGDDPTVTVSAGETVVPYFGTYNNRKLVVTNNRIIDYWKNDCNGSTVTVDTRVSTISLYEVTVKSYNGDFAEYNNSSYVESYSTGIYADMTGVKNKIEGTCNHIEGSSNYIRGEINHVEGLDNSTKGTHNHIEGNQNYNNGTGSNSHMEGSNSTIDAGSNMHTEGMTHTINAGFNHHAEGWQHQIYGGSNNHAEGEKNIIGSASVNPENSHVEGKENTVTGNIAHAEGANGKATSDYTHVEGRYCQATNSASHAEGFNSIASGGDSHAQGYASTSSGAYSHAGGYFSRANSSSSISHGQRCLAANAIGGIAMGLGSFVGSSGAVALGGDGSWGIYLTGSANATTYSFTVKNGPMDDDPEAFINGVIAINGATGISYITDISFASDFQSGTVTVSASLSTSAISNKEGAMYLSNVSMGRGSFTVGSGCKAYSSYSHAEGISTKTDDSTPAQFVAGKFNNPVSGDLFEIGNGTKGSRANALRVDSSGNLIISGELTLNGTTLTSKISDAINSAIGQVLATSY